MTATDFRSKHVFEFIPRFEPESVEYWGRLPATSLDLAYAFNYIDTAKVDWHVNLSVKQSEYVGENVAYFQKIARVLFRKPTRRCQVCGEIDSRKLDRCSQCKETYYCCRQYQREDWPDHRSECQHLKDNKSLL
jgi:hypothetical protein